MRVLTFDLEEWFHLLDHDATRTEAQWGSYEVRIHENTDRLLRILDDTGSRATFLTVLTLLSGQPSFCAISSSVGSRPRVCMSILLSRTTLLICSIM